MNAFNFILIKDPHFQFGFRNNIRKHGWENDIDKKIDQIIIYAKENNINHLFFTGDIFEKSHKKDWSLNQLQQNKKRLKRFKTAGIEVYSNAGNHDYFDGREAIEGTVFGELVELGLINYIGTDTPAIDFRLQDKYISLYGIDYHQDINKVLDKFQWISAQPRTPGDTKIVLVHSNITDDQNRLTDFTYNQLAEFDIDIIGCGHWHLAPKNGAIQNINQTWFLNPWNMTRVARDYHVKLDEHRPQFIHGSIVMVGDEPTYEFKENYFNVRPFSEAFNVEAINLLQELGKTGFEFFKEIELDKDEDMNDDEVLLNSIADSHSISKESIRIAKEILS